MKETMTHTIRTSTACIGHFIDTTIYETYLGELWGGIPYNMRDDADKEIGESAVDYIEDALWSDVFPSDCNGEFAVEYVCTYHPKYYNFETDSVVFDFAYTDKLCEFMLGYAAMNRDNFEEFLEKKFTSYDGFASFTPNNWDDWYDGYVKDDFRCVSALLYFMLIMCANVDVNDCYNFVGENSYQVDFLDSATNIISEDYTPYEYAVKYDNGMIAVVFYDGDKFYDTNLFNAYLIDTDGNVVHRVKLYDKDAKCNCSAFAAFQYTDMESVLTKECALCNRHSEPCDVPEMPDRVY